MQMQQLDAGETAATKMRQPHSFSHFPGTLVIHTMQLGANLVHTNSPRHTMAA